MFDDFLSKALKSGVVLALGGDDDAPGHRSSPFADPSLEGAQQLVVELPRIFLLQLCRIRGHVERCGEGSVGASEGRLAFWHSTDGGLDRQLGVEKNVRADAT